MLPSSGIYVLGNLLWALSLSVTTITDTRTSGPMNIFHDSLEVNTQIGVRQVLY